jgi:1-acyl-sn-glycerol-3-phosphate acyltransferase
MADRTYPAVIRTAKGLLRLIKTDIRVMGAEHIPSKGGALLAINHLSYLDFVLAGYAALPTKRLVRFMAKKEIFDHAVAGPLMRSMHHIPVNRRDGVGSYHAAVDSLRSGELVGIFPEATISRSFEIKDIKTGAVRIAQAAEVPLIPMIVWGSHRIITKDHPRDFSRGKSIHISVGAPMPVHEGDAVPQTAALRARMQELLAQTIDGYPADEQPPGSWWLPASRGGSAPTPERAAELDREELARRAAKRRK